MIKLMAAISAAFLLVALANPAEAKYKHRIVHIDANGSGVTYLPNPCTYRRIAFCGCAARIHLGIDDRRLDLVANWPRYYRGSTQVAVWRHHVAVIDRFTGPHTAILFDYNSGGHRSRHWERDLRGARIIGGHMAMN